MVCEEIVHSPNAAVIKPLKAEGLARLSSIPIDLTFYPNSSKSGL